MAIRRIKTVSLKVLNGINEIKVPPRSYIIGASAVNTQPDPVHIFIVEEVPALGSEVEKPEQKRVLVTTGDSPFSDPKDSEVLQYIGTVIWDNGYRINHVFEVEEAPGVIDVLGEITVTEGDISDLVEPDELIEELQLHYDNEDLPKGEVVKVKPKEAKTVPTN